MIGVRFFFTFRKCHTRIRRYNSTIKHDITYSPFAIIDSVGKVDN